MDQEGGVGTTWPIALPQGLLGLVALIRNHPYRGGIRMSLQSLKALLGSDTEAALAVVNQKTGLVSLVCLVHLGSFFQPNIQDRPNRPNRPDRPNEQDRLAEFFSTLQVLLLCTADTGIIPSMRHTWTLIGLLAGLCLIGATTTQLIPAATEAGRVGWMLYLIAFPLALAGLVWIGWTWTAMACVIYGTVGLALDLATVTSILSGQSEIGTLFLVSAMSGTVNFSLILFGGRAFLHSSLGTALPVSRPPNPPSPSSSAKP